MKSRILSILIPTLLIFLTACTEKIDIELDGSFTRLVVDGCITSDTMAHEVRLTTSTSYFENQPAPRVTGANVRITDGFDTIPLEEVNGEPGIYRTAGDVYGIVGRTYTLLISLAEAINGHSEYSASSAMRSVAPLDSIKLKYYDNWEIWEIQCYAYDPPSTDFYLFNTYKNGILITDTITESFFVDDRMFNGNYTNGVGTGWFQQTKTDEILKAGDTVTLQIAGITPGYYSFLNDLAAESGYHNPLFSGPPANVKGNISNGAIGFFAAYSVAYATTIAP